MRWKAIRYTSKRAVARVRETRTCKRGPDNRAPALPRNTHSRWPHLDLLAQQVGALLHDEGDVAQCDVLDFRLAALGQRDERRCKLTAECVHGVVVGDQVQVAVEESPHTRR